METGERFAVPTSVDSPAPRTQPRGLGKWLLQHQVAPVGPAAEEGHGKPES
jgi:hypothetical protein